MNERTAKQGHFDVVNETIAGRVMLIEASAGTGKTYSLERLVARLIVEEAVPVQSLLLMTFTRAATAELSVRIRKILVKYLDALKDPEALEGDGLPVGLDPTDGGILRKWVKALDAADCMRRLTEALSRFDDASIFTIHSFCQKMLVDYGFSRGGSFAAEIGNDDAELTQALDEALRATYHRERTDEAFIQELRSWPDWETRLRVLKSQPIEDIGVDVIQTDNSKPISEKMAAWVQETFKQIPGRIRELKQVSKVRTFDDLLLELWRAVKENPKLVENIRARFAAVLVDEFQDTDPIQFSIFKKLFLDDKAGRPVFFVGDPKQSIYGFRSAELEVYHHAKGLVGDIRHLAVNFRSTPAITQVVNAFFDAGSGPSRFLTEKIQYDPVGFNGKKLPLMRCLGRNSEGVRIWEPVCAFECWTNHREHTKITETQADSVVAEAIATDIVSLLDGTVFYDGRPLQAKDIAILVQKRYGADPVISALAKRGVRVQINSNESVFKGTEAFEILALLSAMVSPDRLDVVATARATRLVGHTLKMIQDDEYALQTFRETVKTYAIRVEREGIYPVFIDLMRQYQTVERLLPLSGGARMLANYYHILELAQDTQKDQGDLMEVLHWLQNAMGDGKALLDEDAAKLRVETDENLVSVVTLHASKGLEYPVVYLADALRTRVKPDRKEVIFREERDGKKFYVLPDQPMALASHAPSRARDEEELVRLAYVGMTRASARLVLPLILGVAPRATKDLSNFIAASVSSAYVRALYAEPMSYDSETAARAKGLDRNRDTFTKAMDAWKDRLLALDGRSPGASVVAVFQDAFANNKAYQGDLAGVLRERLTAEDFFKWRYVKTTDDREDIVINDACLARLPVHLTAEEANTLPKSWGRTSFSGINRQLAAEIGAKKIANGYAAFPKGTVAGDFLHKLIEKAINQRVPVEALDAFVAGQMAGKPFFAVEPGKPYQEVCLKRLGYNDGQLPDSYQEYCHRWIVSCLRTLLSEPLADGRNAIDLGGLVKNGQVASETDFLLTAPGDLGDAWDVKVLSQVLKGLSLDVDPVVPIESLKGYLTGQIDLLLRNTDGRYWVIDWKSNAIDTVDSCDNPANYSEGGMALVMDEHHYRLQAICYSVALFRHLQQRYPDKNHQEIISMMGGALYVFLRGVDEGTDTGAYWMPVETLVDNILALDALLLGKEGRA
ncbi:MAG: UvrD-helicase domain-containing protein [Oxalobacter sp.]|nr:UvrD-helicase domain-containing protein [Oxalobacter sp.]